MIICIYYIGIFSLMIKCILELPNKSLKSAGDSTEEDIFGVLLCTTQLINMVGKT